MVCALTRVRKAMLRILVESPLLALILETSGEVINQAEFFVAFAFSRRLDHRLVATFGPGRLERPALQ